MSGGVSGGVEGGVSGSGDSTCAARFNDALCCNGALPNSRSSRLLLLRLLLLLPPPRGLVLLGRAPALLDLRIALEVSVEADAEADADADPDPDAASSSVAGLKVFKLRKLSTELSALCTEPCHSASPSSWSAKTGAHVAAPSSPPSDPSEPSSSSSANARVLDACRWSVIWWKSTVPSASGCVASRAFLRIHFSRRAIGTA